MLESERIEWRTLLTDAFAVSGLSERAVSELARVNRGSLSEVFAGRSVPRAATIEALRRVFELSADLAKARREVDDRRAKPGATPSIYYVPEPGSPEANEPVTWGHMEDRFAELDARIARIEQAVINLSNTADMLDPATRNAALLRRVALHKAAIEESRRLRAVDEDDVAPAARTVNKEPGLRKRRREHDESTEALPDDPTGMEPL